MTRYWYDTEFVENGMTIDLISIGIVADDGREYYAVNDVALDRRPWYRRWFNRKRSLENRIRGHEWLMANVVPSLPKPSGDWNNHMPKSWLFDYNSPLVKPYTRIADEVRDFLLAAGEPELWADYGAYDHVALCWLWGPMIDLPSGVPMFTNDIQQEARRQGLTDLPQQSEGLHNALADARQCRTRWEFLASGVVR